LRRQLTEDRLQELLAKGAIAKMEDVI
jgi:hypothetical protein